jgi:exosortase/archaeosortase family protein
LNWQRIQKQAHRLFRQSIKTTHSRILTCGFLVWLVYLPMWLVILMGSVVAGASTPSLNVAFAYLGLEKLWQQRREIAQLTAMEDEQWVGYALILGGAIAFPFCYTSFSMQALLVAVIGLAMAYSTWGITLFKRYWLWILLIAISLYPDWVFLSNAIRKVITPPHLFEEFMAWAGSLVLQGMGYSATVRGVYLSLPQGAVEIASACSGFDMAFLIVGASVALGLFMRQKWSTIWLVATLGAVLALIFNIPRIVLLTFASVYWGKDSFDFWHGPIGGQIFSGILLTVYYYVAMGVFTQKNRAS